MEASRNAVAASWIFRGDAAAATVIAPPRYSWTAVTSSFLRIFGNATDGETAAKIEKADGAAAALLKESLADTASLNDAAAVAEAAAALEKNRAAVARDASDQAPKTQPHVARCQTLQGADAAIDAALATLSGGSAAALGGDARVAAAAIAARLCAPRDMGAPAARALRHVLLTLAKKKGLKRLLFWRK